MPTPKPPTELPSQSAKQAVAARLRAKGVSQAEANRLAGVGENLTNLEIAQRRIEWQRQLPPSNP